MKKYLRQANDGEVGVKVNQLRDSAIFEEDGQLYLLYIGGGEEAIGIVELEVR